jgi:hypothetical protein
VIVGSNNRIYIWRKKDETESRDCVCPPVMAADNSSTVFNTSTLCCNRIFSFSHTFSITFKSVDCAGHSRQFTRTLSLDSKAFAQSIEGEGRNDKVLSKGKHLFHKFIVFLLMQNLMLECRHLGFCR